MCNEITCRTELLSKLLDVPWKCLFLPVIFAVIYIICTYFDRSESLSETGDLYERTSASHQAEKGKNVCEIYVFAGCIIRISVVTTAEVAVTYILCIPP